MKVTGFTFIRNAIKYDYPVEEAIRSVLPLCDEFVVAVGQSEDDTLGLIRSICPEKIRIVETIWNDTLREGGRVLAVETDKAYRTISSDTDWAFYIQGDEVLHEKYHQLIKDAMLKWKDDTQIDGLLFNYLHFYGSYDYVGSSAKWYPNEIRIVRARQDIYSYRDAQGFRKGDNQKLLVKSIDAYIYHYGWVKEPEAMQRKQQDFNKLWHDQAWIDQHVIKAEAFDYSNIDALALFEQTHPLVMTKRIEQKNWKFEHNMAFNRLSIKDKFKRILKQYFGINLGYKNYKLRS